MMRKSKNAPKYPNLAAEMSRENVSISDICKVTGKGKSTIYLYMNGNCKFAEITCAASIGAAAKAVLQALGLLCTDTSADYATSQCYLNNAEAERLVYRGGYWYNSAHGLFSFSGANPRSNVYWSVGFRSAYYKKI